MKHAFRYIMPGLQVVADLLGTALGFFLAYRFRFHWILPKIVPVTKGMASLSTYLQASIFAACVWVILFGVMGHYGRRSPSAFDRFWQTLHGGTLGTLFILATTFFYRDESFSRLTVILGWLLATITVYALREGVYRFQLRLFKQGVEVKRAVVVGAEPAGKKLFEHLSTHPVWGIRPVGVIGPRWDDSGDGQNPAMWLGELERLDEIVKREKINLVIFNLPPSESRFIEEYVLASENLDLEFMLAAETLAIITSQAETIQIDGMPVIRFGKTPLEGYGSVVKRLFDVTFSLIGLAVFAPMLLIIWPLVKLDSPGPLFYRQKRLGRGGRPFTMYKLRTMVYDPSNKPGWTVANDPRLTRVGRFLRRYNIDELPQLWNVLLGQMSLVGPRPEQPAYVEEFKNGIPRYFQRHKVKCGLTGWSQVNGLRGDTSISERTRYDLYYVENWSLAFDIKIILLTLKNMFSGKGHAPA